MTKTDARVMIMATMLVNQMTQPWDPERYTDEYADNLCEVIERKSKADGNALTTAKNAKADRGNVIDLAAVLQASLDEASKAKG